MERPSVVKVPALPQLSSSARGEGRTRTGLLPADFESAASAVPPLGLAGSIAAFRGERNRSWQLTGTRRSPLHRYCAATLQHATPLTYVGVIESVDSDSSCQLPAAGCQLFTSLCQLAIPMPRAIPSRGLHPWHDLPTGPRPPEVVNAIIEIPTRERNKYELDKEFGIFRLDRVLARGGQAIDEDWAINSSIGYALTGGTALTQTPGMTGTWGIEFVESQAGMLQIQTGGDLKCSFILMQSVSGRSSVTQHANSGAEAKYANVVGVVILNPHKVYDIKGLMHSAIRYGGPVVFPHFSTEASADIPDEPYVVPIGKAQILKEGKDVTIACSPPANVEVEKALIDLDKAGISAEYFDVRTVKPFDEATLIASVKKTGKLMCVDHGYWTNCFSSHIMAVAAMGVPGAKLWMITYPDGAAPYSREMNNWMIPDAPKIVDAVKKFVK